MLAIGLGGDGDGDVGSDWFHQFNRSMNCDAFVVRVGSANHGYRESETSITVYGIGGRDPARDEEFGSSAR